MGVTSNILLLLESLHISVSYTLKMGPCNKLDNNFGSLNSTFLGSFYGS